ncbi:response regulator FixJ [Phenylobacterium montanum]|uniref:Response regulator transcription factor FixJ n=1 Tax=Phenylobacterium montanum TaxID=2823693 RepID=A0A975IU33_9CAUL|nr:response regulator FixJ [Caulobacter sp. S6]QUD87527.1 response regulator transcription factor FixJ [Caulobacter sp. S6]
MSNEPVVHVIDDDEAVRDSLAFLLDAAGMKSRTYESADAFVARLDQAEPGCVVTDVRMPGMSGVDLVRHLTAAGSSLPVVVITGHGDVSLAVEAMKGGAIDFIEKPFDDDTILSALKGALSGSQDRQVRADEKAVIAQRLAQLSTRERQVLNGVVLGKPNKIVAFELGISPRTVEVYRANLMTKMQAQSLSELVRMALLVDPDR